jgi:hypothetical protein
MRGKPQHNVGLVGPVAAFFLALGARVRWECRVGPGRRARAVDLCVDLLGWTRRIVVEAERFATLEGVARDVGKAQALAADLLFIITPTARVRRQVEEKVAALPEDLRAPLWIVVKAKGPGLAWLERTFGAPESFRPQTMEWMAFTNRFRMNKTERKTRRKEEGGAGEEAAE